MRYFPGGESKQAYSALFPEFPLLTAAALFAGNAFVADSGKRSLIYSGALLAG
jgi:hypothetical protein